MRPLASATQDLEEELLYDSTNNPQIISSLTVPRPYYIPLPVAPLAGLQPSTPTASEAVSALEGTMSGYPTINPTLGAAVTT
jgi:hypothetical protein